MDLERRGTEEAVDVLAHGQPSAPFLGIDHLGVDLARIDLVAPVVLVVLAATARRRRDAALLLGAAAAVLVASLPPVHHLAAGSVTGHMVQHLILVMVVAPCLGLAALGMAKRLPRTRRRLRAPLLYRLLRQPLAPLAAGAVHAGVLIVWHLPGPYDAAVDSNLLHGAEHLSLIATGAWWWATVVHHAARRAAALAVVSLFGVATAGAALGVFMMFAPGPLYGQGGVGDQQTAGALMAGGTGAVYGGSALWIVARMVQRLATPRPARIPSTIAVVTIAVGTLALCTLAWAPPAAATDEPPPDRPETVLGEHLYRRDCASCHGPFAGGSERGMDLTSVGTASVTYVLETGRMPISHPDDVIRRRPPAYSPTEIEALVAHLDGLIDGPAASVPAPGAGDLARGGQLYRLHCAACHSAEGIGGALASQDVAPPLFEASSADVANAVLAGPGAMPSFAAAFDDTDIAGVAQYVALLDDPPRTGLTVPGGRVGEGLVAWAAGLVVLVIAARWLGSSA
jgi:ubiquinol-cytochrome c reductase cytochrome c subunit